MSSDLRISASSILSACPVVEMHVGSVYSSCVHIAVYCPLVSCACTYSRKVVTSEFILMTFSFFAGPAAASGDQSHPNCQPGSFQWQSVWECDGPGQSRDWDVQQNPAGCPGGVRPYGEGSADIVFLKKRTKCTNPQCYLLLLLVFCSSVIKLIFFSTIFYNTICLFGRRLAWHWGLCWQQ